MYRHSFILVLLFIAFYYTDAQQLFFKGKKNLTAIGKSYKEEELLNQQFGIVYYEKFTGYLGGDSIRTDYTKKPYTSTVFDFYSDGTILHKGNYVNGTLTSFKNYYKSGKTERNFKIKNGTKAQLASYYPTGKKRAQIYYKEGVITERKIYFENGQIKTLEKKERNKHYYAYFLEYNEKGILISELKLTDKTKLTYHQIEYFENGKKFHEGDLQFIPNENNYLKTGNWYTFSSDGKLIKTDQFELDIVKTSINSSIKLIPSEFSFADTNLNSTIETEEVNNAIDLFFNDDTGKLKSNTITSLINYFFEQ